MSPHSVPITQLRKGPRGPCRWKGWDGNMQEARGTAWGFVGCKATTLWECQEE